jgi:hypothetical protein
MRSSFSGYSKELGPTNLFATRSCCQPRLADKGEIEVISGAAVDRLTMAFTGNVAIRLDGADWFASHAAIFVADETVMFLDEAPGRLFVAERRGLASDSLENAEQRARDEIQRFSFVLRSTREAQAMAGGWPRPRRCTTRGK